VRGGLGLFRHVAMAGFTYTVIRSHDQHMAQIDWDSRVKSVSWFKLMLRSAFNIGDGDSFLLMDLDGCITVVSEALPPGKYGLVETNCVETISSIITRHDVGRSMSVGRETDLKEEKQLQMEKPENFEENLLRIACADAMIANERTYLAWTRTSLSIMACCFTFVCLDSWSERPVYTKILSNTSVVFFAVSFVGCFLVGYVRYRMFAKLLRTSALSSDLRELDVDWSRSHYFWVIGTGFSLAFSGAVYLGVLRRDVFLGF
jgi:uncharacterized membrane protein YidH (DUF202 family)